MVSSTLVSQRLPYITLHGAETSFTLFAGMLLFALKFLLLLLLVLITLVVGVVEL